MATPSNMEILREKCTACDEVIKIASRPDMRTHRLLDVLVCFSCHTKYGDGDFEKFENGVDEDGDDNYCRWCTDGGDLLLCNKTGCHYAYCKKCIKRNFGTSGLRKITKSE